MTVISSNCWFWLASWSRVFLLQGHMLQWQWKQPTQWNGPDVLSNFTIPRQNFQLDSKWPGFWFLPTSPHYLSTWKYILSSVSGKGSHFIYDL